MKRIVLTTLVALLGSNVTYADEIRVSTDGTVGYKGLTLSAQEQVREGADSIEIARVPSYHHTELGVSTGIGIVDVGLQIRNATNAGTETNRVQVTGTTTHTALGLDLKNRVQLQSVVNNANVLDADLGALVLREKLTASKTVALLGHDIALHLGDEIFLSQSGLGENRAFAGASVSLDENTSVSAEYFLQSTGDLIDTEGNTGTPDNGHVVCIGVTIDF